MKKRTKKICSFVLILCLLLSAVPVAAAEAEPDTEITATALPDSTVTENDAISQEKAAVLQLTADCQILRHVDEEVFSAGNHIARLPAEEDLSSYVFLNEDGSKTVYFMDEAVKFQDSDGTVWEKNLELTAVTDGYTTIQNDVQLTLPKDPASGIRLSYDGRYISLIPQGGTLSGEVRVTDNSVTYPDYFGEGISLRYTPTLSGVKEDILLSDYTGVNSFTFLLNTGGLNLYQANGRYFLAESKLGQSRIELGDVFTSDAAARFSLGTMTAETVMPGQAYRLTVTADEAFLTDENTTYPVTIDPTLTISDNTHGAGAIEDVSIYSGKPNTNGNWTYLHSGYYDDTYQTGRTLFRLKGLINSAAYQSPNITSAKFYIREATGTASTVVLLNANSGNPGWTESGATWNNAGAVLGTQYAAASPSYNAEAVYDITQLVKAWQNGTCSATAGFILRSSSENKLDKAFYSSEHSTTSYRPYVVVTYNSTVSLNSSRVAVNEGSSVTLTAATNSDSDIIWTSSSTAVATVSSTGKVTALKAGKTTITASQDGQSASCVVYVTIADGIYYMRNVETGYYLSAQNGGVTEGTRLVQTTKTSSTATGLWQIWKIKHLSNGYYSIRPMHKPDMGLAVPSSVTIEGIGTTDTTGAIVSYAQWTISFSTNGYVFKNQGVNSKTLTSFGNHVNGSIVGTATDTVGTTIFRWALTRTATSPDLLLYSLDTGSKLSSPRRGVKRGATFTLADMNLAAAFSCSYSISQTMTWSSANTQIATVNASTGAVTGVKLGSTKITASKILNGVTYTETYTLVVSELPISGYEAAYEPGLWNRTYIQDNTNCYTYAINNQIDPTTNELWRYNGVVHAQQPGMFYNYYGDQEKQFDFNANNNFAQVYEAVTKDFEAYNAVYGTSLLFTPTTADAVCPTGSYKVALCFQEGSNADYHWYRQDPDGYWSHKVATDPVTRYDADGNLISNPETADRGTYTDFVGYFAVTPWNYMASDDLIVIGSITTDASLTGDGAISQETELQSVIDEITIHVQATFPEPIIFAAISESKGGIYDEQEIRYSPHYHPALRLYWFGAGRPYLYSKAV